MDTVRPEPSFSTGFGFFCPFHSGKEKNTVFTVSRRNQKDPAAKQGLRAGDGNRTHVASLEGWNSTIELHPHKNGAVDEARTRDLHLGKVALYQLSYYRKWKVPWGGIEPPTL